MTTPPAGQQSPNGAVPPEYWRRLVLAERASIKLDRQTFLRIIASHQDADQVVADLVAMFHHTDQPPVART